VEIAQNFPRGSLVRNLGVSISIEQLALIRNHRGIVDVLDLLSLLSLIEVRVIIGLLDLRFFFSKVVFSFLLA
jgi:hypothetical protein